MPSIARILVVILLLVPLGRLLAQTSSTGGAERSSNGDSTSRPAWVDAPWEPSERPVKVAPPVASRDENIVPMSFEATPTADNEAVQDLKLSNQLPSQAADDGSSAQSNKPKALPLSASKRELHKPLSNSGKPSARDSLIKTKTLPSMTTVLGSLGVVIGLFLLITFILRRAGPQGLTRLPDEAFEVLGRATLAGRQQVHLLRCGNKLLLVSVTQGGTETLTEITDPQEVDRLAGLCRQGNPHSSTAAFRQVFEQLAPRHPSRGTSMRNEFGTYDLSGIELSGAMGWERRDV